MPIVSVIIPTFNRANVIEDALKSALNQTLLDIEILVCDDASTDATIGIVESFQKRDPRVYLLSLSENQGSAAARNLGLRTARGKYIAFLDSDDVWGPEKLEFQVKRMNSEPEEVGVCICGATIIKNGDASCPVLYIPRCEWEHETFHKFVTRKMTFLTPTVLFRRNCLKRIDLMVPDMRRNQDEEFLLRLFSDCKLAVIQQSLAVINLVVSSKNTYLAQVEVALPYHLRHYELVRRRLGWWTAATYRGKIYLSVLCEAIRERQWYAIWHYSTLRIRGYPFLSLTDISQLLRAVYRGFIS